MSRKKNEPAAASPSDVVDETTAAVLSKSDVVADAIQMAASYGEQEAADDAAWRRETESIYAIHLLRADQGECDQASELSHCIDALKLRADHVRRDQETIGEFRRQLSLHGRRTAATEALVTAVEARKTMEKRHKQEAHDALLACERARRHSGDCGHAASAMAVLEHTHPRMAAAFAAIRENA